MIKNPVHLFFRWWYVRLKPGFWSRSYLNTSGFTISNWKRYPVDAQGRPVPWMNYSFIDFISPRLNDSMHVFEYGSGNSTMFFSKHTKDVVSIEHDLMWIKQVQHQLNGTRNVQLLARSLNNGYVSSIKTFDQNFDIVIIDGKYRNECVTASLPKLSPRGVIILDDSSREEYAKSFHLLKEKGFKELTIAGLKPVSFERHQATIFYRQENCLNI